MPINAQAIVPFFIDASTKITQKFSKTEGVLISQVQQPDRLEIRFTGRKIEKGQGSVLFTSQDAVTSRNWRGVTSLLS
jgi:hypothetical protein